MNMIELVLLALDVAAILFYCYGIYAAIAFVRHPPVDTERSRSVHCDFHPPVSILKPICGLDRDVETNLISFCQQDYPQYQIIFAVRDRHDPAIELIEQIIQQFPDVDTQLVVCDRIIGANLKVSNLANAVVAAKYEVLLIADSDICVGKNYLQQVVKPLQDESVGVVTCLYRSLAQGWVTILEALGTATDFHAGVLVSNQSSGIKFAFGSTIVIRQQVLAAIGGFAAIADYLADDFQLGYLPSQAGYKVVLSNYIVDHVLNNGTVADAIHRQIRWARCIRISQPWGYLGLIFSYGTVTSWLLLLVSQGAIFGWLMLAITWVMRLLMGWVIGVKILRDSNVKKFLLITPVRDFISFAIWCLGFFGSTIEWRGEQLKLQKGGKMTPVLQK